MSGTGPPSPTPNPPPSCNKVRSAPLNSPQPGVADKLSVNDRLYVYLDKSSGRAILQVRDRTGRVAGSLTFLGHLALIECIEQGYSYEAVVMVISGGAIQLRIEPVETP
jgi:hypothetical protein